MSGLKRSLFHNLFGLNLLLALCFLQPYISKASVFDFNLTVTVSDETCLGNGAIQMSASNTTPGSTIFYDLYLLPDSTNSIAQTTSNEFSSLQAGNYRVVATEVINGNETTQFQDVTIENLSEQLDYTISHSTVSDCDSTGVLTVNISSGNPVTYEIVSGPVTAGPQANNVFTNLPAGTYVIRVYDNCNDAVTKTYTMVLETNNLGVSESALPNIYDSCDSVTISNSVTTNNGNDIIYPLDVTYTIFPPDGSPDITFNQTISSDAPLSFVLNQTIPLFGNDIFNVSVSIMDQCGNVFESETEIDPNPKVVLNDVDGLCGKYLQAIFSGYFPPYTINFIDTPTDFIPADYNADYPGPFSESLNYFGDDENPVPEGLYMIEIVDSCGRTVTKSIEIVNEPVEPVFTSINTGCDTTVGQITISIPDRTIVLAQITAAPVTFQETLPFDITDFVIENNEDTLSVTNLPVGDYIVYILDDCGYEYDIEISVPEFILQDLFPISRPDCNAETGSLSLFSPNGKLETVVITSGPSSYSESFPVDVSNSINSNGGLYLFELPEGNYALSTTDICGNQISLDVLISAYQPTPFAYNLTRNCGSFNIEVFDNDPTVTGQTYWFQKYYPSSNSWGHPNTGVLYSEGNLPNTNNAIQLFNETPILNIFLTGDFRIIKAFQSFNDSSNPNSYCLDSFEPFTISENLIISGIYNLDCENTGINDIVIDAVGVQPFNFSIVSPISLDNGDNNIFSDLADGIYEIKVEDACGNIENITLNTENLLPLARAYQPEDLFVCSENGSSSSVFDLSSQNTQILGSQNPDNYLITFYTSQVNANAGINSVNPTAYTNTSNPQTIYARIDHKTIALCYSTTSFLLRVGTYPDVSDSIEAFMCEGETTTLTAPSGYLYEWSTGETTQSIAINSGGSYSVTIKNSYGNFNCDAVQTFTVTSSSSATINDVTVTDWTSNDNSITVSASGPGNYVYSLDGVHYQEEPVFTNLTPGEYTVYVMDVYGCGIVTETVAILNYPKFFTPNGDNFNDTWHINNAGYEPELEVTIFDRYGKFIKNLHANDYGWDGTYNGYNLPTSDYWFVATRADGRVYKGHFTLKR